MTHVLNNSRDIEAAESSAPSAVDSSHGQCVDRSWGTLIVQIEGPVVTVTLNRPERLNALSPLMLDELTEFWPLFEGDPALHVAIITGAGDRAFCSGADVATVADRSRNRTSDFARENRFTPLQAGVSKPTICAVNGVCAGGGLHFVADCDFTISSDDASFLDPHVSVGQVSALEAIVLARRVPLGSVLRMVLMGRNERLTADRALQLGLVTEVVAHSELHVRAMELAGAIATGSPTAIAVSRAAIWASLERPLHDALIHAWVQLRVHGDHHPDAEEGPRAFAERREPRWEPRWKR